MNGSAPNRSLDPWQKREVERKLVAELHSAQEAKRLAQIRSRLAREIVSDGVPHPDSNLAVAQACIELEKALKEYAVALARWKNFVIHGTIPDDLYG